jgi:hypothetical protein
MTASLRPKPAGAGLQPAPVPVHWVEVLVQFAPSPAVDEDQLTRGERLRLMQADAQRHRRALEEWLDHEGLAGEVSAIGEATAFDLLFAKVTPQAAAALEHAPDVVAVMPTSDRSH